MRLDQYLASFAGPLRLFNNPDSIQIDKLYYQFNGQFGFEFPELDLSEEVPEPEAGPIQVYSVGIHYGEEEALPRPVGAIFFRNCVMQCTFCSELDQLNVKGRGISKDELGRLIRYLSKHTKMIDLVNPDLWYKMILPVLEGPTIWNTHGYKIDRSHLDLVDVVCLDVKFTSKQAIGLSNAKNYEAYVFDYLDEALSKLGPYKDGRGVYIRYLVLPGVPPDILYKLPKDVPVHVMDQFLPMPWFNKRTTPDEIAGARELARELGLIVWSD